MPKMKVRKSGSFVDLAPSGLLVPTKQGGTITTPTRVSYAAVGDGGATITVTKPASIQVGDLLLLLLHGTPHNADLVPPDGTWTKLGRFSGGAQPYDIHAWYKTATGSEPASYAFTNGGAGYVAGALLAYRTVGPPTIFQAATALAAIDVPANAFDVDILGDLTDPGWNAQNSFTKVMQQNSGSGMKAAIADRYFASALSAVGAGLTGGTGNGSARIILPGAGPTLHNIASADAGYVIEMGPISAGSVVIPNDSTDNLPVGTLIWVRRTGTAPVTVGVAGGVTLTGYTAALLTVGDQVMLQKKAANAWHAVLEPASDLATQLEQDAVVATLSTVVGNNQAAAYTLVLADAGKVVELNNASALNLTIPTDASVAFPVGTVIELWQQGAGQVTVVPAGGVTLRSPGGLTKLYGQYSGGTLRKRAANEWVLQGDLA